jgi:hypothetical protein
VLGFYTVVGDTVIVPEDDAANAYALCETGDYPTGGGSLVVSAEGVYARPYFESGIPVGWHALARNGFPGHTTGVRAYVICADLTP